jgi:hypothetical protein
LAEYWRFDDAVKIVAGYIAIEDYGQHPRTELVTPDHGVIARALDVRGAFLIASKNIKWQRLIPDGSKEPHYKDTKPPHTRWAGDQQIVGGELFVRAIDFLNWAKANGFSGPKEDLSAKASRLAAVAPGAYREFCGAIRALAAPTKRPTAKGKGDCRKWLVELMAEGRPKTESKESYRRTAINDFKVSGRQFDSAWAEAIEETGDSAWGKAGRPKNQRTENPSAE